MNKKTVRIICLIIVVLMLLGVVASLIFAMPAFAVSDFDRGESIYVDIDEYGNVLNEVVSVYITNIGNAQSITDYSILKNIDVIMGEKTSENNNVITFNTNGSDICYQGKTDKQPPFSLNIKYYLNGNQIAADELAGKSGHIKIEINSVNNLKNEVIISGEKTVMYTPFTIIAMLTMGSNFKNIKSDNAKLSVEAGNTVIIASMFPGLRESLNLSEEFSKDINDGFCIEADVDNFELESGTFIGLNGIIDKSDTNGISDLLNNKIDDLNEVGEASKKIDDTAIILKRNSNKFANSVNDYVSAVEKYIGSLNQIIGKIDRIKNDFECIDERILSIEEKANDINDYIYDSEEDERIIAIAEAIINTIEEDKENKLDDETKQKIMDAAEKLSESKYASEINQKIDKVNERSKEIVSEVDEVKMYAKGISSKIDDFERLGNMIVDGGRKIKNASNKIANGIEEFASGIDTLHSEAVEPIMSKLEDAKISIERKDKLFDLLETYKSFSGDGDTKSSVKFIVKTKRIYVPKPIEEAEDIQEQPNIFEQIWEWIKNLFS